MNLPIGRSNSVASITTAYNVASKLPRQLDALLAQGRALQEVIVIDNASIDGTCDLLASRYPQVTLLRMAKNLGAAGAWAVGLQYAALEKRHDWVWAFDDDSVPEASALERLLAGVELADRERNGADKNSIGMAAMLPVHLKTGRCYPPLLWRERFVKPSAVLLAQPVWLADLTYTSGLLVRRKVVESIGLPRADFFMDFFDFEYCLRARANGYSIAVVSAAKLAHEIGTSRSVGFGRFAKLWPEHAPWREYYMARNLAYSLWWLYPSARAKRFAVRHLARHVAGVLLFSPEKAKCLKRTLQGFFDGCRARLGVRFLPEAL